MHSLLVVDAAAIVQAADGEHSNVARPDGLPAASGMTNRQIGQQLFVTVKTVETHLAAAYDKLGIRSRRQLPAALGEHSGSRKQAHTGGDATDV